MTDKPEEKKSKRDEMMRCKHCKKLFRDDECTLDPLLGLICPNGCKEQFVQPPYESPSPLTETNNNEG